MRAPFTTDGFSATAIPIPYIGAPFGDSGRGDGTAHFWTMPGVLPPQITINSTSVREGTFNVVPANALTGGSAEHLPAGLTVSVSGPSTLTVSGTPQSATIPGDQHRFFDLHAAGAFPQTAVRTYDLTVLDDHIFADDFEN